MVLTRAQYTTYCLQDYSCMMGQHSCQTVGFIRSTRGLNTLANPSDLTDLGKCLDPKNSDNKYVYGMNCLNQTQKNCFDNSVCVIELELKAKSKDDLTCQIPDAFMQSCSTSCSDFRCKYVGYYQNSQGSCVKVDQSNKQDCEGTPLCGDDYRDQICRNFGFINVSGACKKIEASDCLQKNTIIGDNTQQDNTIYNSICSGSDSYCVTQFKFTYNKLSSTCDFDCLTGNNCTNGSFCLSKSFGYAATSEGKCKVSLTLNDCLGYKTGDCPHVCTTKYKFYKIKDKGCIFPPHSVCDLASENSEYGCSSDKYFCSAMGWTQVQKGSNKCQDPTESCLSQTKLCQATDFNSISLGNYLGLIFDQTGGWSFPTFQQCYDSYNACQDAQNACSNCQDPQDCTTICQDKINKCLDCYKLNLRSNSFCRRSGFELDEQNKSCKIPLIESCNGKEKCQEKLDTVCKTEYGFTNSSTGQKATCNVPTDCSSKKKKTSTKKTVHACEIGGFVQLSSDMNFVDTMDIFKNLNMNNDLIYKIVFGYCQNLVYNKDQSLPNLSSVPICGTNTSVCNQIGFSANSNGTCDFPSIESCLVAGSGKCGSNNICLRIYKLQKSSNSNDCVLPFDGDNNQCKNMAANSLLQQLHYCSSYFGFNQISDIATYCSSGSDSAFCVEILKLNLCDFINTYPCGYTNYLQYNSFQQKDYEFFYNIFTECMNSSSNFVNQCNELGFVDGKIPEKCSIYDGTNYNHACHMKRAINPNDIATLCLNKPNCSNVCIFYGFIKGSDQSQTCQLPDATFCSIISQILDTFYHACAFLNYNTPDQMPISQYCLRKGLNMCQSKDVVCVKYYNFSADQKGDCVIPDSEKCLIQQEQTPILCKIMIDSFYYKSLPIFLKDNNFADQLYRQGIALDTGYIVVQNQIKKPKVIDCLNKPLCQSPKRISNPDDVNYFTPVCITIGFKQAEDKQNCDVDPLNCQSKTTVCSDPCKSLGFVSDQSKPRPLKRCYTKEQDRIDCNAKQAKQSDYCDSLGYKWVTDHYELPTHEECEDSTKGYCKNGKITCTSRGWTSIDEKCVYKINCLDKGQFYCQKKESICFYLGYVLNQYPDPRDQQYYQYDCIVPSSLNCSDTSANNCMSQNYSICSQQGFKKGSDSKCLCSGVVYQGVCFIVNPNKQLDNLKSQSSFLLFNMLFLFSIILVQIV